ncbi:MAG: regulatory protein GemA [Desulfovibrio sp.]|jgi:phage gp16-like protein|nr:regulatory protein GemA [Desulfovibrio sp.]
MACAYQRFIQMTRRSLGMDDETYRQFLESVTGKRSTTEMTQKQRYRVVEELKRLGMTFAPAASGAKPASKKDAPRDGSPQARLVRHLWLKLKGYGVLRDSSERALLAYVKRITGVDRMEWLRPPQMNTLIETLKQWVDRVEAAPQEATQP